MCFATCLRGFETGCRGHGDAGPVVVLVHDVDIRRIEAVVSHVGGDHGPDDDRVGHVPIVEVVFLAGDGHGLRGVPVRWGEAQRRLIDFTLGRISGDHRYDHVGGRLSVEHHIKRLRRSRLRRPEAAGRCHGDAHPVVIEVRHQHRLVADVREAGIREALAHPDRDQRRLVSVRRGVVLSRDDDGLSHVPVGRREGEQGRRYPDFQGVGRKNRHGNRVDGLCLEQDGQRVLEPGFTDDREILGLRHGQSRRVVVEVLHDDRV